MTVAGSLSIAVVYASEGGGRKNTICPNGFKTVGLLLVCLM